jgi:hypothetical protein
LYIEVFSSLLILGSFQSDKQEIWHTHHYNQDNEHHDEGDYGDHDQTEQVRETGYVKLTTTNQVCQATVNNCKSLPLMDAVCVNCHFICTIPQFIWHYLES